MNRPQRATGLAFRLILAFFAGLFGVVMVLIAPGMEKPVAIYLFGAFCLAIAGICFVRGRAQRVVGSLVALAVLVVTLAYLISEIAGGPLVSGSRASPSVLNAVIALVIFGLPAAAYLRRARFGIGAEPEIPNAGMLEINDVGVTRTVGSTVEQIRWDEVEEIKIITTDDGPFNEDVFFALVGGEKKGCLVPHGAAEQFKLLEQLQSRFEGLDDEAVVRAMGSTSNAVFLLWKRPDRAVT